MGKTTLINIHHDRWRKHIYIGRGSAFGNPYVIGKDEDREEVIEKYKKWFYKRINNERFLKQVLELKGEVLGCYCHPLPCHGDIIIEFLNNYTGDEK